MKRSFGSSLIVLLVSNAVINAGGVRTKVATEAAEYVLQRFGKQVVREGTSTLARKIEAGMVRHGEEFVHAIRKVGPQAFHLAEQAGAHGNQAVRAMARHGEHGAIWIVARPKGMQLYLKHGESAAAALVKHKGIAEPVIERFGASAINAMQATSASSGRRLAMMVESGELSRIGRSEELLGLIARFGDRAMSFVWNNKGALAVSASLAAFLANPEPFINGTRDVAQIIGESAVKPLAQAPVEAARRMNWTLLALAVGLVSAIILIAKLWCHGFFRRVETQSHIAPTVLPVNAKGGVA